MTITEGQVAANDVQFAYLEAGAGPLALCLHGFPDSAWTYRHLLPALAEAGYHAVAPFMRGYAPTAVPADGRYQSAALALDACALHEVLGGGDDAVIIGHDWGALATYSAANHEPERWRRVVTMAVPPAGAVADGFLQYRQLKKSWYMFFFQHGLADMVVGMDDLAFIDGLWADWSPGYDGTEDLVHVKDALRDPANLAAALGYYRATLSGVGVDPALDAVQTAGSEPTRQPTLYLHGRTDGCMGVEIAEKASAFLTSEGSRLEIVDGAGHFLHVEKPAEVNRLILDFVVYARRYAPAAARTRPSSTSMAATRAARTGSSGQPITTASSSAGTGSWRSASTSRPRPWRSLPSKRDCPPDTPADPSAGSGCGRPARAHEQPVATGHSSQRGSRRRHTPAPRSSIAWFQAQACPGGTDASAASCAAAARSG
jgi:pimeloyl-ACP methyl ester carboxylesterase